MDHWVSITLCSFGLLENYFQEAAAGDSLTSEEVKTKLWCWSCLLFSHVLVCVWIWN